VDGSGSATAGRSRHTDGGAARSYTSSSATTITAVVLPVPRAEDAWPLSGTITNALSIARDGARGSRASSRTATVTFNGTQFVPLQIGDRTFTLDLATGRPARR
jgi:hypothetical protein